MSTIENVNQDIETTLKQDKSERAIALPGPIVAMPVPGLSGTIIDLWHFYYAMHCISGSPIFSACNIEKQGVTQVQGPRALHYYSANICREARGKSV